MADANATTMDVDPAIATSNPNPNPTPNATDVPNVTSAAGTNTATSSLELDPIATNATVASSTVVSTSTSTSAHLASLLATALADLESVKEELASVKKRAERAERLVGTFGGVVATMESATQNPPTQTLPPSTIAHLTLLDDRTHAAEQRASDALARLAHVQTQWTQLNSYLSMLEGRAQDARAGFGRIVQEGPSGGSFTSGGMSPPLAWNANIGHPGGAASYSKRSTGIGIASLPLPPIPGTRRPRESLEQFSNKRLRQDVGGEYAELHHPYYPSGSSSRYPAAHSQSHSQNQAPSSHIPTQRHGHSHGHAERSPSTASDDLDALLLESANASPGHAHAHTSSHREPHQQQQYAREREYPRERDGGREYPRERDVPSGRGTPDSRAKKGSKELYASPGPGPNASLGAIPSSSVVLPPIPGQAQGSSLPSSSALPAAPVVQGGTGQPYPATNTLNQRICRQCGHAGRYKDGKCVEKWGPGPLGPGTVCDRCRKKMKRVERRGTVDALTSTSMGRDASLPSAPQSTSAPREGRDRSIQRAETMPSSYHRDTHRSDHHVEESNVRSTPHTTLALQGGSNAGRVIKSRLSGPGASSLPGPSITIPARSTLAGSAKVPNILPPLKTRPADTDMDVDELVDEAIGPNREPAIAVKEEDGDGDSLDADAEAEVDDVDEFVADATMSVPSSHQHSQREGHHKDARQQHNGHRSSPLPSRAHSTSNRSPSRDVEVDSQAGDRERDSVRDAEDDIDGEAEDGDDELLAAVEAAEGR